MLQQEDAIFLSLALGYGQPRTRLGMFEMFPLPAVAPLHAHRFRW